MKKIVAVCACPMGLAHTFMAADSLEKAAKELGAEIKIELYVPIITPNNMVKLNPWIISPPKRYNVSTTKKTNSDVMVVRESVLETQISIIS